jgi:hypothetical protein
MSVLRLRAAALVLAAGLGLAACSYDRGYGYYGVGYNSYCDPYWGDCYYGYGGYGYPSYYGWYDNFYYPGIGIYIYDRYGKRHRWNDHHRRYWEGRRHHWHGGGNPQGNWSGYRPPQQGSATPPRNDWRARVQERREDRVERREVRRESRQQRRDQRRSRRVND